ncbi:MAG: hypothetical protein LBB50_05910 [Oscillospiraceae bacterium]|jgi:hypothetical protein|nr:hypothetical protein [Oscillospiraceae bacterium]
MKKKVLAILLTVALFTGVCALPAQAAGLPPAVTDAVPGAVHAVLGVLADTAQDVKDFASLPLATQFSGRGFFIAVDALITRLIQTILTAVETLVPAARSHEPIDGYTNEHFLPGDSKFEDQQGVFSLGYDSRSIMPADFGSKAYRMGGYDFNKTATESIFSAGLAEGAEDYLKVRTIVLDDGTGRGAMAFAVLDVIGLANGNVRAIRAKLSDLVDDGTLSSINVAVTHSHSAIDSQGLWGNDLLQLIPNNIAAAFLPGLVQPMQGIDQTFLQTMVDQTADSIRAATAQRQEGTLYFAKENIKDHLRDVIDPYVMDENLYRLRFVPDATQYSNARATVIASFSAHPERVGLITDDNPGNVVSADFIPYIEQVIQEEGDANFLFVQGPIGARISAGLGPAEGLEGLNRLQGTQKYGQTIGRLLLDMQNEEVVAPTLNIAHKEVLVEVKNPLLKAVGKLWLADNKMINDKKAGKTYTLTEVGYLELGSQVKVLLQPGETSPELLLGGSNLSKNGSASGKDYPLSPLRDTIPDLMIFDLVNDSIGYIIPDSDSTNFLMRYIDGQLTDTGSLTANLNDALLLTFSTTIASVMQHAFLDLVDVVR